MEAKRWEITKEEKLLCPFTEEEVTLEHCESALTGTNWNCKKGCKYLETCTPIKRKIWEN